MSNLLKFGSHSRVRSRAWLWLVMLLALVSTTFSATFTATLDRNSIALGEQVVLTLKFENGQPQEVSGLPQVEGLRYGPVSQSSQMSFDNGTQSSVVTYTVPIEPTHAGDFVIPAFRAKMNGQIVSTQPITLKVAAGDASAPSAGNANRAAFISIVFPKTNLFVNEPVVAEFQIYIRSGVHNYNNLQLQPDGNDLSLGKFVEGQHYQRNVGGAVFTVIPLSLTVTPVKSGTLSLNPINGSILLNARDPMDFGGFFEPRSQPQQVPLTSDRIDLQVSDLPKENIPPGFNGAIGTYTMTVTAGPTNLVAGDPVTLRIQISGRGSLDSLVLPDQTGWDNFKVYPPTSKLNLADQLGIQGSKTFEEIVTPQNSEIKALPPVSFSFFDPEQKKYRTLTQPPIPLIVRAANPGVMPAMPGNTHSENSPAAPDILPIKQHLGVLAQIQAPLIQQPLFLGLQGVPVVAFVYAFFWRRRKESIANNPRLRRQRQVAQLVRDGLVELHNWASENKSDEFFATLFRLLQEQLGERLDLPASSITEAVIEEHLRPRNVPEATLDSLHEMFQTCNLVRYAPIESSEELAAIIPKLEQLLNELREMKV